MTNVVPVEVDQGTQKLVHYHGCLSLCQVLALQNKVEKLASLAVPATKEKNQSLFEN